MNTKTLAQQALRISQTGKLPLPDGGCVDFSAEQQAAQRHTVLYRPSELAHWRETLRQPETPLPPFSGCLMPKNLFKVSARVVR